jgi:hypothetical protein
VTIDLQTCTATVAATALEVIDGSVTLDDSWAPYLQGRLTVETPADTSILDPRTLPTMDLVMTQRFGDGLQFTSDLTTLYTGGTSATLTAAWASALTSALTALIGAWNAAVIGATSLACLGVYITDAVQREDGTTQLTIAGGEHRAQQLRDWLRLSPSFLLGFVTYTPVTIRNLFPYLSPGTLVQGDVDLIVPAPSRKALFGVPVESPSQDQWEPLQAAICGCGATPTAYSDSPHDSRPCPALSCSTTRSTSATRSHASTTAGQTVSSSNSSKTPPASSLPAISTRPASARRRKSSLCS